MSRSAEWFLPSRPPTLALWWLPAGRIPTIEEALGRLERLRAHGPGPEAFGFAQVVGG